MNASCHSRNERGRGTRHVEELQSRVVMCTFKSVGAPLFDECTLSMLRELKPAGLMHNTHTLSFHSWWVCLRAPHRFIITLNHASPVGDSQWLGLYLILFQFAN